MDEHIHDPLHGIDSGPCDDFAPDSLGDDPNVCIACFYHKDDHIMSDEFTFEDAMNLPGSPKKDKPKLQLVGMDGNAYFILGRAMQVLRRAGYTNKQIDAYEAEATSGDYDNLLAVTMNWFDVS